MKSVNEMIEQTRKWFYQQLEFLNHYPSEPHRLIILLYVMDSFAQDNSNFSRNSQKAFVEFLWANSLKYSDILKLICPVTLYYSQYDDRKDICLQLSCEGNIYPADSLGAIAEAERLFKLIPDSQKESVRQKHSYAGLIYQLRNKLSHELLLLNSPINFHEDRSEQFPHIICEGERRNQGGNHRLVPRRWTLHIPEKFVRDVAIDAVEHYLEDCLRRNHAPFCRDDRRCYNGWYD